MIFPIQESSLPYNHPKNMFCESSENRFCLHGSGKLLFGSDFPICSPGMNLYGVLSEHLSRPELENIFSNNFKRLIHAEKITPSR